jgi:hypothetical protein
VAGDIKTAMAKCKAAMDLLDSDDIYGPDQARIRESLLEQVAKLTETEPPQ